MHLLIRHKLFLVILMANVLLAAVLFASVGWNFSRSFQQYLGATNLERLSPLLQGLAVEYRNHNQQWGWLTHNHRQWRQLLELYLGRERSSDGASPGTARPEMDPASQPYFHPPPEFLPGDEQVGARVLPVYAAGLLLRDTRAQLVMGRSTPADENVQWLPVTLNSELIAELGVTRTIHIGREIDQLFAGRLLRQSAWIVAGILLLSICLALPFARRLVRPVTQLQRAMQRLSGGDFNNIKPLQVEGRDELAKLADSFNLLTDTLRHNLRARQQWIADISHELRTPVAILCGELEALIDGVRVLGPEAVESLHAESMRLARLINDLYELSLSDMGALSYRREPLSLHELLQELVDNAETEIAERGLTLEYQPFSIEGENGPDTLFADGDRLMQLFRNLLTNSLRYTRRGGRVRVRVAVSEAGCDELVVCWEDSEPGVREEDLQRLFERLYCTDSARVTGGSGLGLAICQAIVEAHRGRIQAAHSALGGLAVYIYLPLHKK